MDAISFDVRPGQHYDFAVLLNGRRCCHTRISTMREVVRIETRDGAAVEDSIPFTLGRDGKIHITGRFNDSLPLDLLIDFGADSLVLFPSGLAKNVKRRIDGTTENLGTGGATTRKTSNDNRVTLGRLHWDHESLLLIEKHSAGWWLASAIGLGGILLDGFFWWRREARRSRPARNTAPAPHSR